MNPTDNNPQTDGQNLGKLESDLGKLTQDAASTSVPPNPVAEQNVTVQVPPPAVQPVDTPPPAPNVPIETPKKGMSMMTVAIVLLIVALVVAIGYMVYVKFMAPTTSTQTTAPLYLPTDTPAPLYTPVATDSALPTVMPSSSPSASVSPSASATP